TLSWDFSAAFLHDFRNRFASLKSLPVNIVSFISLSSIICSVSSVCAIERFKRSADKFAISFSLLLLSSLFSSLFSSSLLAAASLFLSSCSILFFFSAASFSLFTIYDGVHTSSLCLFLVRGVFFGVLFSASSISLLCSSSCIPM